MYHNKKIGISIPAYNEQDFIAPTLAGIPGFIDHIYVIDDGSQDQTVKVVTTFQKKDSRVKLIVNSTNQGNGYSVTRGLKKSLEDKCDVVCIMAGDNQCRQEYLSTLISSVVDGGYDYAKANRFIHKQELMQMPRFRFYGNLIMSLLSKFASGYYSIVDPLNSYSAIKATILSKMDFDAIPHRYDFENGWLLQLYLQKATIIDIPVPAKYAGEKSDIHLLSYIPRTSHTIWVSFWKRILDSYVINTLHPIALFLFSGLALLLFGLVFGLFVAVSSLGENTSSTATVMLSVVPFILGIQLLLQAIVLDIQNEPRKI